MTCVVSISATWVIGPFTVTGIAGRDPQGRKRVFSTWSPPVTRPLEYEVVVEFEERTTELARLAQALIDQFGIDLPTIDRGAPHE